MTHILINRLILLLCFFLCTTTHSYADSPILSIELQGAQNEINNNDFYSLNASFHKKGTIAHTYGQLNYAGFPNIDNSNNVAYENIFIGFGAEYNGRLSPYFEAGIDAGTVGLMIVDMILDDMFETNCREKDNCLSDTHGNDAYLTLGIRLFVTKRFSIGAFIERLSFSNPDTDNNIHFKVSGMNIRYIFN